MSFWTSSNMEDALAVNGRTRTQTLIELALSVAMVRICICLVVCRIAWMREESSVFRRSSG